MRTRLACRIDQTPQHRERTRDDAERFGEAGDRQSAEVADEMPAGGLQTLAAEAEDLGIRLTRVQFAVSAPAYRSPDGSPQEIMIRIDAPM